MPKFNVIVTRDCTESTVVDVEAIDAAHAKELALAEAMSSPHDFEWKPDDFSGDQSLPAVTGCDEKA